MTCPATTWFATASYGSCAGCGDDIVPDDTVRPDGTGGYLCEGCGDDGCACDCI